MTGATEPGPAHTHAIIRTNNGVATAIEYPDGNQSVPSDGLRDVQVTCYAKRFFEFLKSVPDEVLLISRVISRAIEQGEKFQVSEYRGEWYHFAEPKDLEVKINYLHDSQHPREGRRA